MKTRENDMRNLKVALLLLVPMLCVATLPYVSADNHRPGIECVAYKEWQCRKCGHSNPKAHWYCGICGEGRP